MTRTATIFSFEWKLLDGPVGVFAAGESSQSGVTEISVPTNGVYRFQVKISDGVHVVTERFEVEVDDSDAFGYEGRLLVGDEPESGAKAQLVWGEDGDVVEFTKR